MTILQEPRLDTSGPCGHPLVDRLVTEFSYPHLTDTAALDGFVQAAGAHCVFLPGEVGRNLETPDVAVVLPELVMVFQRAFDCAVAQGPAEEAVKEAIGIHKTPSLVFFRDGKPLGAIPRVRDWDDYMARVPAILAGKGVLQ